MLSLDTTSLFLILIFAGIGLACAISLLRYLRTAAREKRLLFNQVTPLGIPAQEVWLLFFLLVLTAFSDLRSLFYPLAIVGVLFLYQRSGVNVTKAWGVRRFPPMRLVALSLWLCAAVMLLLIPVSLLVEGVSGLFHTELRPQQAVQTLMDTENKSELLSLLGLAIFIAPIAEEIFFRGLLYPVLKFRMPIGLAVIFTSFLFALIHLDIFIFFQLFLLGIVLALVFEQTGSLLLCIGIHTSFNAFNALWLLLLRFFP